MAHDYLLRPNIANPQILSFSSHADLSSGLSALGLADVQQIPSSFDWRKKAKLGPATNQGMCGNCWAMSSTNALADKFAIFKGAKNLELDQLITTFCAPNVFPTTLKGCGGGMPYSAGQFFEQYGAAPSKSDCDYGQSLLSWEDFYDDAKHKIASWQKANAGHIDQTQLAQFTSSVLRFDCKSINKCKLTYRAQKGTTKGLSIQTANSPGKVDPIATVRNIKLAIMNTGPVVAVYQVYNDFQPGNSVFYLNGQNGRKYKWDATNGIYIQGSYAKDLDELLGKASKDVQKRIKAQGMTNWNAPAEGGRSYHAVEVVGWGEDKKYGPYWIIKNSWGREWGDDGYWKHGMWTPNRTNTCLLDVPHVFSSTGGLGGCTTFTIDESSGEEGEGSPDRVVTKPESKSHVQLRIPKNVLIGIVSTVCLLFLIWVVYRIYHRKTTRSWGSYHYY